jgi:superfamily II DNA or RNA helicase
LNRLEQIEAELRALDAQRRALAREQRELLAAAHAEPAAVPHTPDEKIALFLRLFRCRQDVYPKRWENPTTGKAGYAPACRNEWVRGICRKPQIPCTDCPHQAFPRLDEAAAREHLTGKSVIGTYAIREDHGCVFLAADFDGAGWQDDIRAYQDAARELGIEAALERSRSGKGGHAWVFFEEPVPALMARRLGTLLVAKASAARPAMSLATYDRLFPNQDILPDGGFGNLIALPLQGKAREQGHTLFLDDDFQPHPDPWTYLAALPRLGRERLDEILEDLVPPQEGETPLRFEDRALDVIPAIVRKGDFTGQTKAVRRAQLDIPTAGLSASLLAALKRLATMANPVFFEKQRLRFGTWNTPRFLFLGEAHADRLVLPRGAIAAAEELFHKAGGSLRIEDRRPSFPTRDLCFHGTLTPEQQRAVDALLVHDDGVLLAPPGAGKTVMGCALIAARRVPTLVLVHRKPLLEQWRSRLESFLGLGKDAIGVVTAEGLSGTPEVALAMIQTFVNSPQPGLLFAPFGHVIIDECHHVPAASFEAVMKTCTARHFLGLTATPVRKDGLQKILFLQCGPVRHRMEIVADPNIERRLIVREIPLGLPPEEANRPLHELWEHLASHPERNRIIATDIVAALREGRRCAVLSDRKEHLAWIETGITSLAPELAPLVHRIDGGMSKKSRSAALSTIMETSGGFALVATSSLVGEGFDLPQLDTLFLTLPVSFQGRIVQYAGRLHRTYPGKTEVRIYDYVEPDHPITAHMHRKRLHAYHGMGYRLPASDQLL